ncbi:kinase-like protein [Lojkania enalia]|uniref:Kinase-like protein n=1 Tax=Lojkania enalia TaxID=147567 RepID=A0A9P4KE03_9PLEO|nr:kinase-like protein [Didymosphaeria enalia]
MSSKKKQTMLGKVWGTLATTQTKLTNRYRAHEYLPAVPRDGNKPQIEDVRSNNGDDNKSIKSANAEGTRDSENSQDLERILRERLLKTTIRSRQERTPLKGHHDSSPDKEDMSSLKGHRDSSPDKEDMSSDTSYTNRNPSSYSDSDTSSEEEEKALKQLKNSALSSSSGEEQGVKERNNPSLSSSSDEGEETAEQHNNFSSNSSDDESAAKRPDHFLPDHFFMYSSSDGEGEPTRSRKGPTKISSIGGTRETENTVAPQDKQRLGRKSNQDVKLHRRSSRSPHREELRGKANKEGLEDRQWSNRESNISVEPRRQSSRSPYRVELREKINRDQNWALLKTATEIAEEVEWQIGQYRFLELGHSPVTTLTGLKYLGQGRNGFVEEVQCRSGVPSFVRKRIEVRSSYHFPKERAIEEIKREIAILRKVEHPHVVKLLGSYQEKEGYHHSYFLLMSPVGENDLEAFLRIATEANRGGHQNEKERTQTKRLLGTWFLCLSSALAYLHNLGIRHEDIKPKNIVHRGDDIYFTDFGSSRLVDPASQNTSTENPALSTRLYAAPEAMMDEAGNLRKHGAKSDVFALGTVFVEMLTVLDNQDISKLRGNLPPNTPYHKIITLFDNWFKIRVHSHLYHTCIKPMLAQERKDRPSASEVADSFYVEVWPRSNCPSRNGTPISSGKSLTHKQIGLLVYVPIGYMSANIMAIKSEYRSLNTMHYSSQANDSMAN